MAGYFDSIKPRPQPTGTNNVIELRSADGDTRYGLNALTSEAAVVASAPEGTRNDALNTAYYRMGRLVPEHLTIDTIRETLREAGRACGLPDDEITMVLRDDETSAARAGQTNPRHVEPLTDLPEVTVLPDLDSDAEALFWASRDMLKHLHDFARARRVSPWAVLGVAMARMVARTPYQVCLPPTVGGKASLNLFVGLVGPSGSGKGAAEAVAADAIDIGKIETHTTGSGEGIAHGFRHREKGEVVWNDDVHAVLFSVSEIDTMAAQGDRKGATLMPELRRAWSGEQLGFGYADPAKRLPVPAHEYRMCLVAGIQPARAGALLNDADGGTPQRFLWMPAIDPKAPDTAPEEPEAISWRPPGVNPFVSPGGIRLTVCEEARTTIEQARLSRLRGTDSNALDGHALLARLKVAAAFAVMDARLDVTDDDWRLAGVVMRKSDHVRGSVEHTLAAKAASINTARAEAEADRAVHVEAKLEDAALRRVCGRLMRKLRAHGDWMGSAELRRSITSSDRGHFGAALDRLKDAGQVEESDTGGHGMKSKYRAIGDES